MKKNLFALIIGCLIQVSIVAEARTVFIHFDKSIPKGSNLQLYYTQRYTDKPPPISGSELPIIKKNGNETFTLNIPDDQSILVWGIWIPLKDWAFGEYDISDFSKNPCNTSKYNALTFSANNLSPLKLTCSPGMGF